jgi:SAM-dependent methyltransferase
MFTRTTEYYDRIYSFKHYGLEASRLRAFIRRYNPGARRLLDVACGTGRHLECLREHYLVQGVDISPQFVRIARRRNPGVRIWRGDMTKLGLPPAFDVVVCLFSSIGYVQTAARLEKAVCSMAEALSPKGILVIEPWFSPAQSRPHTVHAVYVDEPDLKIARISTSRTVGGLSVIDMHYLIGTARGTRHYTERHRLGLFTAAETKRALRRAGLRVSHDEEGLTGRGLYIGKKQSDRAARR